jgi:hypothetical protein
MLAVDVARASGAENGNRKKKKAGTQGVGLVVRIPPKQRPVGFDRRQPAKPAAA